MSAECEQRPDVKINNLPIKAEDIKHEPDVTTEEETDLLDLKNNVPPVITVRCGPLTAKMHVEQFLCPGIHQPCIELHGEPELITPKLFTIKANKDKQKDWKGSIRIGKSNLRTLMEMRTFDFHNHSSFCSAKCQSRNYITPKEKDMNDSASRRSSLTGKSNALPAFSTTLYNQTPDIKTPTLGTILDAKRNIASKRIDLLSISEENRSFFKNPTINQLVQISQVLRQNNNKFTSSSSSDGTASPMSMISNLVPVKEELIDVDDSMSGGSTSPENGIVKKPQDVEQICNQMAQDPTVFWTEMMQCGLADNVIDQMVDSLNGLREKIKNGNVSNVAPFLSRTIASLGICDRVMSMIRRRNSLTTNVHHRLSTDYSSVEDTLIRKRSIDDTLAVSEAPEIKRPCVQYPKKFQIPTISAEQASLNQRNVHMISAILMQAVPNQSPSEMLMQFATNLAATSQQNTLPNSQTATSVQSLLSDSLLAIK